MLECFVLAIAVATWKAANTAAVDNLGRGESLSPQEGRLRHVGDGLVDEARDLVAFPGFEPGLERPTPGGPTRGALAHGSGPYPFCLEGR